MTGHDRRRFAARGRFLAVVLFAGLALVVGRTVQLQVLEHDTLTALARGEYLSDLRLPARRGQVYDRHGKPLAISVDVPSVFANPAAVVDPRTAARRLAPVLGLDLDSVYQRLAGDRLFVWLKRQVTPEIAAQVTALHQDGVGITKESRRFYPNREVAAHLLGFVGVDGHGLEGIERIFDPDLAGEPQVVPTVRDARGKAVLKGSVDPERRTDGSDLRLTLDLRVQHSTQTELEAGVRAAHAKGGIAVVLDVGTAEVLALATVPAFNPNQAAQSDAQTRRNRAVTDLFEPGSSLKPIVVAAALEARAIEPGATLFCENGAMRVADHTIRDTKPHGWLSVADILAKSSNIGAAKIGANLGRDRLAAALRTFGFGERSGVELPGEVAGLLRPAETWSTVSTATISFGHGVAVNALQLGAAYRVLAADGRYLPPTLIQAVLRPDGAVETPPVRAERRVLAEKTAARVTGMLEKVVSADGTGLLARVPGYRVAGKTGTAQKPDPVAGGYSADRYVAVFAGYLPAEAPRVVIVVAIDEPEDVHTGGAVAAPVFASIGLSTMRFLGVVPSEGQAGPPPAAVAPPVAAESTLVDNRPPLPAGRKVAPPGTVPSFLGMTSREVLGVYAQLGAGLNLEMVGSGRVVSQDPSPGAARAGGLRLRLNLANQ
ncbi:MAG: transpeptidase family protein [Deltaproteobacteria bacterium]|nr:transpeptidase family protein [Deltaproteobacteria bacterium]